MHKKTVAEATVQSYETKPLGDSVVSFVTLTEEYSDQIENLRSLPGI